MKRVGLDRLRRGTVQVRTVPGHALGRIGFVQRGVGNNGDVGGRSTDRFGWQFRLAVRHARPETTETKKFRRSSGSRPRGINPLSGPSFPNPQGPPRPGGDPPQRVSMPETKSDDRPARAGINPTLRASSAGGLRLPRARGDQPRSTTRRGPSR